MTAQAVLVLTSHDRLGDTGRHTGAYFSEVADAWAAFTAAGLPVAVVSVQGGPAPLEAVNPDDPRQRACLDDPQMQAQLASSRRPADVSAGDCAVLFFAGGHGAAWDLPYDDDLAKLTRSAYEQGAVIASVCHGAAALVNVTLSDGTPLVAGRRVCAFTNDEERAVGMTDVVPFLLADELQRRGAIWDAAPPFMPHVVVDGRLVTGQNPPSATEVAEAAVRLALDS